MFAKFARGHPQLKRQEMCSQISETIDVKIDIVCTFFFVTFHVFNIFEKFIIFLTLSK